MGLSKWRKLKLALGISASSCLYDPKTLEDSSASGAVFLPSPRSPAPAPARVSDCLVDLPITPTPSSSGIQPPPKHSTKSTKRTCAICLTSMKAGHGQALFTAECSHSFHFHCIASSVKHGNKVCPVCRAKWKEIPLQNPPSETSRSGAGRVGRDDSLLMVVPPWRPNLRRHVFSSVVQAPEPFWFDDDELVIPLSDLQNDSAMCGGNSVEAVEVKAYAELPAVSKCEKHDDFHVLIHLKAPSTCGAASQPADKTRAPIDLVTLLDVSGSMAGTKLALLKRAMGFVVQNLGPSDRLSVVAFSSSACRLFPLRRMTENGKKEALQSINSLSARGGTNIFEALKKGAKVVNHRKFKNPVSSIVLLSDGQDTYAQAGPHLQDYMTTLLPSSLRSGNDRGERHVPVHAFGFGADHDSAALHAISESSGGTFSFIENESIIQDAFAQCIGGLLSVVVQELLVKIECMDPVLLLGSIKAGSYKVGIASNSRSGFIEVGDLYAEEERDFLVTIDIPAHEMADEMSLVSVTCVHKDPIKKEVIVGKKATELKVLRLETTREMAVSVEVDRQRWRVRATEAMAEARAAAENGDLISAVSVLKVCCKNLSESAAALAGDRLCLGLVMELKEMEERMASQRAYESSGRAYVLAGLSSHSWQRATTRGNSADATIAAINFQTPSMVDMVSLSQTMHFDGPSPRRSLKAVRSLPARPQPR